MSALNGNEPFIARLLGEYPYSQNCVVNGELNLWHYFGTHYEISQVITSIAQGENSSLVKFPSFLNFLPVEQRVSSLDRTLTYNVAIAASTNSKWTSDQRERLVFDTLLRPIYEEFIRQIGLSGWFQYSAGDPAHSMFECYTTGEYSGRILNQYSEYIDAIEIRGLQLPLKKTDICIRELERIESDNSIVISKAENLLTSKK
jgi:hypothetical protein